MDCERVKMLLMLQKDGEITDSQQRELQQKLDNCHNCSCLQYWQNFTAMEEEMQELKFIEPQEQAWRLYWNNVYNQIERRMGWILASCGAIVLILYAIYEIFKELWWNTNTPVAIKIGLAALITGMTIVFVSVVRESLILRKHDPFERIRK
ncbi:hypothetical protein [Candidatus Uabimicrobium amorphum]|uniref:Uncharacterized protein n=1 Tax=Uabimicrobium amorphum TaxID=2596890 RepID=A0A5S9IR01_UABAM|nr:hypothetical protein [Candidatus Uabimicrobium amorphum]BBM86479.1 hypothetical protein UABAM_04865 [Candidatus Uabimicrobium amorphum]